MASGSGISVYWVNGGISWGVSAFVCLGRGVISIGNSEISGSTGDTVSGSLIAIVTMSSFAVRYRIGRSIS